MAQYGSHHILTLLVEGLFCVRFAYTDGRLLTELVRLGARLRPHAKSQVTLPVTSGTAERLVVLVDEFGMEVEPGALTALEVMIGAGPLDIYKALAERRRHN